MELFKCSIQISTLSQHAPAIHMRSRGLKTQTLKRNLIVQIPRLFLVGVAIRLIGRIVVFARLCRLADLVPLRR